MPAKNLINSLLLLPLFLFCFNVPAHAEGFIYPPPVTASGQTFSEAMTKAYRMGVEAALEELGGQQIPKEARDKILSTPEQYISKKEILERYKTNDEITLIVKFTALRAKLESARSQGKEYSVDLQKPKIAFALVPVSNDDDNGVLTEIKNGLLTLHLNSAMQREFDKAGFETAYNPEIEAATVEAGRNGDPVGYKKAVLNIAKNPENNINYLMVGVVSFHIYPQDGWFYTNISISGSIYTTYTANAASIGFEMPAVYRNSDKKGLINISVTGIAKKVAEQQIIASLLDEWNDQIKDGQEYIIEVCKEDDKFQETILEALSKNGKILDANGKTMNQISYIRLRYQSNKIRRDDLSNSVALKQKLGTPELDCEKIGQKVVIAPLKKPRSACICELLDDDPTPVECQKDAQ